MANSDLPNKTSTSSDTLKKSRSLDKNSSKSKSSKASEAMDKTPILISPTIAISRFGLQYPKDMVTFLRSHAGQVLITEIGTELAILKFLTEYQITKAEEKAKYIIHVKASAQADKDKDAEYHAQQQRIILDQNKKAIEAAAGQPLKSATHTISIEKQIGILLQSIEGYERAIRDSDAQLVHLAAERERLEEELAQLIIEGDLIAFKYDIMETELQRFAGMLSPLMVHDYEHADVQLMDIEHHIEEIKRNMDDYLVQISEFAVNNQPEEAAALMKMHTLLGLKLSLYQDLLSVKNNLKYWADEHGHEVASMDDAFFILERDIPAESHDLNPTVPLRKEKIYKDEYGNHYLLKPGQSWDSIKENQEAKFEAIKNYEYKKPSLMTVKTWVLESKKAEFKTHEEKTSVVKLKINDNEKDKNLIQKQKNDLESFVSQCRANLNELEPNKMHTVPIAPSVSAPTPRPTDAKPSTQFYKSKYDNAKTLGAIPEMTPNQLLERLARTPGIQLVPAQNVVYEQMKLRNIPSTAPIPQQTMQFLLRNLERYGVDVTKLAVTNIKNPLDLQKEAEHMHNEEQEKSTVPTPFNIKP